MHRRRRRPRGSRPTVLPLTVSAPLYRASVRAASSRARAPPASSNCFDRCVADRPHRGEDRHACRRASRTARRHRRRRSPRCAVACRCLMQLIEPDTASIAIAALANAPASGCRAGADPPTPSRRCARRSASRSRTSAGCWRATGAPPGSDMPSASHTMCIEFAVPMPEHTPGPRIAFSLMPFRSSKRELARDVVTGAEEHFLDVHVMVVVLPLALIAADHQDGRNVEARRRHQMAGHGLVAGGEADHAVELRAFDLHLDVVGDQVAARQDVVAGAAGAVDEVATAPWCGFRMAGRRRRGSRPSPPWRRRRDG